MRRRRKAAVALTLAIVTVVHVDVVRSQSVEPAACRALAELSIEDTNLLSAAVVTASEDLPEYCRVLGYVLPAINFEVRLPTTNWNGKFYMAGCGGFCGRVEADIDGFFNSGTYGLKRNYAVSKMDGGHWGDWRDGRWGYHNRQAEIDFGYRAVHETARVTKELISAYYGGGPEYSYFQGCSTGGRQGMMEVQRYPDDFDGVLVGAPAYRETALIPYIASIARANRNSDGTPVLADRALDLLKEEVYEACDASDGLEDGLLSDPRACRFDVARLLCGAGQHGGCLTAEQVAAAKAIYSAPANSDGEKLSAGGVPFGGEGSWGWIHFKSPNPHDDALTVVAEQFIRYLAFDEDPGEAFDLEEFDVDRDPPRMQFMSQIYNADDPDLNVFAERGGKVLIWHGWADVAVPPEESIAYYDAVEGHFEDREATQDFLRLFMIPGMDHCGITNGPGIDQHGFDPLTALEEWVEHGNAPSSLLTTKTDSTGQVLWTRPVCPYPQRAVYDGQGSTTDASNFVCADHESH